MLPLNHQRNGFFFNCKERKSKLWHKGSPKIKIKEYELSFSEFDSLILFSDQKKMDARECQLVNEFLICNHHYVDLNNLTLEVHKTGCNLPSQKLSVKISTNSEYIEIVGVENEILKLIKYVRRYTIQSNFQEKYKIIKLKGKGQFAKVFKIKELKSNENYAVKTFKITENLKSPNYEAILNEIQILRDIDYVYLVRFYEVYEESNYLFIILEYLEGGELYKAISGGEILYNEKIVQNLIWKLLSAATYMHKKNILHRDLKPENIILRRKNDISDIVIADFGLADYYDPQGNYMFPRCGTIGYVAPEVFITSEYDYKVDIYSIGILMYILMSGQCPFEDSDMDVAQFKNEEAVINFETLIKNDISFQGVQLCKKLLEKDPKLRCSAEDALDDEWFTYEEERIQKFNLSLTRFPKSQKGQRENIRAQSPLWNIYSAELVFDTSPLALQEPRQKSPIFDQSEESPSSPDSYSPIAANYFKQFSNKSNQALTSEQGSQKQLADCYEVRDDFIEIEKLPVHLIKKYQLTVHVHKQ